MSCDNCENILSLSIKGNAKVKAKANLTFSLESSPIASCKLPGLNLGKELIASASLVGSSKFKSKLNNSQSVSSKVTGNGLVRQKNNIDFEFSRSIIADASLDTYLDKFIGDFKDFSSYEKIYPSSSPLLDEGIFTGKYHLNNEQSTVLYNDGDFISLSDSISLNLQSQNKSFKNSNLILRLASNASYRLYDVYLKDASNNIVYKYQDIEILGDGNFTTYSLKVIENFGFSFDWDAINATTFKIVFNVEEVYNEKVSAFNNYFDDFFDADSKYIKMSALEVANNGNLETFNEISVPVHVSIREKGERLERFLKPKVLEDVNSLWKDSFNNYSNTVNGKLSIANQLSEDYDYTYATLVSPEASGTIQLKFDLSTEEYTLDYQNGGFSISFNNAYDLANLERVPAHKPYFSVDEIYLKIRARKRTGGLDFPLDVVGWSDDGLLNISTPFNFLDNLSEGSGTLPLSSGWLNLDNEAIAGEAISDISEYYETLLEGANHYKVSNDVIVNSDSFQEYIVPLRILQKETLGLPKDYSQSPSFESLKLSLYPIPSGASISSIKLGIKYKPSNALALNSLGGNLAIVTRETNTLLPIAQGSGDSIVNAGSGYAAPSLIENIPHGYLTPNTIKTNYSRRWVGVEGSLVAGPFNPYEFDFGYNNPQLTTPFLYGYYDFSHTSGLYALPRVEPYSLGQPLLFSSLNKIKNIGLRQKTKSAFPFSVQTYDSVDIGLVPVSDAWDTSFTSSTQTTVPVNPSGFSIYLKFSPATYLMDDYYDLISFADVTVGLGTKELGYINLSSTSTNQDGYVEYNDSFQYPVQLILTYNQKNNGLLSLYVKYDGSPDIYATAIDLSYLSIPTGINVTCLDYLHELGISTNNLIDENDYTVDLLNKEMTIQEFLRGKSTYWSQPGESYEDNLAPLPSYIDDNTANFDLGAFKFTQFTSEFDFFTERSGKDFINFNIYSSGTNYPSSGLSYSTQLENDFLRFNLSEPESNFHSTSVRIEKGLTEGYIFNKRAIVAETILDYSQNGNIVWSDGKIGPKLIVSLYSKNNYSQDMYPEISTASGDICLVNRKEFYLDPYTSWERLDCTFDPETYWGYNKPYVFNEEFTNRFDHEKLRSLFLQYDLEVPYTSGVFDVKLNLHAANVKLDNALVKARDIFNSVNIYSSGDYVSNSLLNIISNSHDTINNNVNLHALGSLAPVASGYSNLVSLGGYWNDQNLNILTVSHLSKSSTLFLNTFCQFQQSTLNLLAFNNQEMIPFNDYLPIYTYSKNINTIQDFANFVCYSSIESRTTSLVENTDTLNIFLSAFDLPESKFNFGSINVFMSAPQITDDRLNLFLDADDIDAPKAIGNCNIYSITYPIVFLNGSGAVDILWNNKNFGRGTEEFDEGVLSIPASADIRDQQGICWGECQNSGTCIEEAFTIHDINWIEDTCIDGGIARPFKLNDSLINPDFYDGGFYGARKYTGLIPDASYDIKVKLKTGSNNSFSIPTKLEDVEYGTLGNIKYSGVKLFDSVRSVNDSFGKAVKTLDNLSAISAPNKTVQGLDKAGSILLYRRQDPINSGDKASWVFEEEITLPSGLVEDYYYPVSGTLSFEGVGTINQRQWQIGQEGREFGYSLDLAKDENRELLAVGAPGAKWSRTFDAVQTSGINFALFIFSDEFNSNEMVINPGYFNRLWTLLEKYNFLYKYFSANPTNINMKLINIFPTGIFGNENLPYFDNPNIVTKTIPRTILNSVDENTQNVMLSGIKEGFFEAFPFNSGERNNNIPPFIAFYVDNSQSMGRGSVEPAIDRFLDFYKGYSFASGVRDIYNVQSTGVIYEKLLDRNIGENHFTLASGLITEFFDASITNLDIQKFITSGVGTEFNVFASEFNLPPDSGGRVYVYENFGSGWNLIQEISTGKTNSDRFGHCVALSKNTNTLAITTPFSSESLSVYEFKTTEKTRLYNSIGQWLKFRNDAENTSGQYTALLNRYTLLEQASGTTLAGNQIYLELNDTDKFKSRSDKDFWLNSPIQEFSRTYAYGINNLISEIDGQFKNVVYQNAPNPRLGYSVSLNSDGSLIALGSPTDSLGVHDNADFYFKHEFYYDPDNSGLVLPDHGTWLSNINAGAVRVFEKSKKVVKPNKDLVIEYNKFGNLSNTLNGTEIYDENGIELNTTIISKLPNYSKTDFADYRIPDEASTIFIVTPEVDAVNDEVVTEIKRWLALGDRRLVLVGDDPVWEKNGAYAQSNVIINKLLERLDSRMRLRPARNEYEALLIDNNYSENLKTNVIESFVPNGSNDTTVKSDVSLNAFGVADIKLHVPEVTFTSNNWGKDNTVVSNKKYGICKDYNPICTPFIGNGCDLRAEWTERDLIWPVPEDGSSPYVYWARNLPFEFFSNSLPPVKPDTAKKIALDININNPGMQPRPILVAAEFESVIGLIPAIPAVYEYTPIYETVNNVTESYLFTETPESGIEFLYSEDLVNVNYVVENIGNNPTNSKLFNPEEFLNKDAILQGKGIISTQINTKEVFTKSILDNKLSIASSQTIYNSEVFLVAAVTSESPYNLSSGNGNDFNIAFYNNLVKTDCSFSSIIQLGGWTGRKSFKEGYSLSKLKDLFVSFGHTVQENWEYNFLPETKNVLWIANAIGIPSDEDINLIKTWLSTGNKKLIITYSRSRDSAYIAKQICDKLELGIKPWFVPNEDKLALVGINNASKFSVNNFVNYNSIVTSGCSLDSKVLAFSFEDTYCPINAGNNTTLIYNSGEVYDRILESTQEYKDLIRMNTGINKIQFSVLPGSGYRLYYRWYSDFPGEDQPLYLYFNSMHYKANNETKAYNPSGVLSFSNIPLYDFDANKNLIKVEDVSIQKRLESVSFGSAINTSYIDIQVPSDKNYINLYVTANSSDRPASSIDIPKTCKLLDVTGHLLPITKITEIQPSTQRIIGYTKTLISPEIPASSVLLPPSIRPIMTDNTKYCVNGSDCGNQLVADGPVLVAEEPENFSDFTGGINRSTIVLISDSSLINGRFENDLYGNNHGSEALVMSRTESNNRLKEFLNSLLNTYDNTLDYSEYTLSNKIVSPEIGSPALYGLSNSGCYDKFVRIGTKNATIEDFVNESDFDESKIVQHIWPVPPKKEETWDEALLRVSGEFQNTMSAFGINSRMKYSIDGTEYEDSSITNNLYNKVLQEKGYDFLSDNLLFSGGYPGHLFGYSVSIMGEKGKEKIIVSSPFNGWKTESVIPYSGLSDLEINGSGGCGSVFAFERYEDGWQYTKKIKPSSCKISDAFGYSLETDSDILCIGSPNHDYNTTIVENSGDFVRKEFNAEFEIGTRLALDSGNQYNNIGAIYVYENGISNFSNREKDLKLVEKVNANGYQNYQSNSRFGSSVSVSRNYRPDSDYSIITGSNNYYGNSGIAVSGAGAAYINDLVLRYQPNSIINNQSWISASVFGGYKDTSSVTMFVDDLQDKNNETIYASGKVYSDNRGQIFIEVSGQDPRDISFISQRPYIESIEGYIQRGTPSENIVNIYTNSVGYISENTINLHTSGPQSDIVYNNLNISTISTYSVASGLNFVSEATSPLSLESSGLMIHTSGIGILNPVLDLRIRGK
jgi:hypothetical protein